jgi:predicted dehydrogenase
MIGTDGHIGMVLDGIPKIGGAALVAYAKSHPSDSLEKVSNHPAFTKDTIVFDNYRQMLEQSDLDIVGVCRPYHLNAEASIAAANCGTHIVSEKPVATTESDLEALENAILETGVRLTAMFGMRLLPAFKAAKAAVEEGQIGEPLLATAQKSYKFGTRPDFFRNRETYGGTIPWVAIHAVDYTRWITGMEFTKVGAIQGNLSHPDYPGCEDQGGIMFQLSNGGTALVNFDYLRPDSAQGHGDDRLRIAGSEGVLEITNLGHQTEVIQTNTGPRILEMDEETDFLVDFVQDLKGISPHVIEPDEAIHVTRICLEARRAADSGQIVDLA